MVTSSYLSSSRRLLLPTRYYLRTSAHIEPGEVVGIREQARQDKARQELKNDKVKQERERAKQELERALEDQKQQLLRQAEDRLDCASV